MPDKALPVHLYDGLVAQLLPRLRLNLDFMPSPLEDRPGLLLRDSYGYSPQTLIIPPLLAHCLPFFDGAHTELDMREELVRMTNDVQSGSLATHLVEALHQAGFLEDEIYDQLREARHSAFRDSPVREPSHAGSAYPDDAADLTNTVREWIGAPSESRTNGLLGIAAPHVSPGGGHKSYRAAYQALDASYRDRTFMVLGTSHYGQPEKFGMTRKNYRTPWGDARTDLGIVDELMARAPEAVVGEDYCHAVEHSIEFQVLFLQYLYGPDVKVVPVLCGPFARSLYEGGKPEDDEGVRRFFDALGEIGEREKHRLFWVLGIDMAHMGRRYGDQFEAVADKDEMARVALDDSRRIGQMEAGDAGGFWDLVQPGHDELKWCGSSPVYTFLKSVPGAKGALQRYEQWNIDEQSVVSFAGMTFS
jgi:AmmeMemoRadiSam system protein B